MQAASMAHVPTVSVETRRRLRELIVPSVAEARAILTLIDLARRDLAEARVVVDEPHRCVVAVTTNRLSHGHFEFTVRPTPGGGEIVDAIDRRQRLQASELVAFAAARKVVEQLDASRLRSGRSLEDRRVLEPLVRIGRLITSRRTATLAEYDAAVAAAPDAVRDDSNTVFGRLLVASLRKDVAETIASLRVARRHPQLVVETDGFIASFGERNGLFEEAFGAATRLQRAFPNDVQLAVVRANALMRLDRDDDALAEFDAALRVSPGRDLSYLASVAHALHAENDGYALAVLKRYDESGRLDPARLYGVTRYREFLRSGPGREWRQQLGDRDPKVAAKHSVRL